MAICDASSEALRGPCGRVGLLAFALGVLLHTSCRSTPIVAAISREQAISATLTYASCLEPTAGVESQIAGLLALQILSTEELRCLMAAGADCHAAAACVSATVAPVDRCDVVESCEGDSSVSCFRGLRESFACGRWGAGHCMSTPTGATCAVGTCTGEGARCDGELAVNCNARRGLLEAFDCGPRGRHCAVTGGTATCTGGGETCQPAPDHCDGDVLVACRAGRVDRTDCSSLATGATCIETDHGGTCGFGDACDSIYGETCDGDRLTFCAAGELRTVDCVALGFAGCGAHACKPKWL
jgi:hypothetical protein